MVQLTIHVTHSIHRASTTSLVATPDASAANNEKLRSGIFSTQNPSYDKGPSGDSDIEKSGQVSPAKSVSLRRGPEIHPRRPDIAKLVPNMVDRIESNEKTIVVACGPESLMLTTRSVVANIVRVGDRNITLHCEQFGW
jgi:hypothetical protein